MKRPILLFGYTLFFALFVLVSNSAFAQTCSTGFTNVSRTTNATAIFYQNSVSYPEKALATSDAQFAKLDNATDDLILKLGSTVKAGDDITIYMASDG